MDEFTSALRELGIELYEVRQSERYPAGAYNAEVRRAMDARELIFDTLAAQQTSGRHDKPLEERRREYFPFKPFCATCGRDDTQVTAYEDGVASYRCRHGHEGTMSLADGEQISGKLVWKVDWPMRWAYEGVAFEPAGEDHHAPTGSFTVGSALVREVFGGAAAALRRLLVRLARRDGRQDVGLGGRRPDPRDGAAHPRAGDRALAVHPPPAVAVVRDRPLGEGRAEALRRVGSLRRRARSAPDASAADAAMYRLAVRTSAGDVAATQRRVSFRLLAAAADLTQGNREQIGRIVAQHLDEPVDSVDELLAELEPRLSCAIAYVELLDPEQRTTVRAGFDEPTWTGLDEATREGVRTLARELGDAWTLDGLTALVYAIPKVMLGLPRDAPPNPELKVAQRTFFKALYQLLVASDTGPRLPTLMLSIGPDRTRELLVGDGAR